MKNTPTIAIIGGGFCGMMTAVHLMKMRLPFHIVIINSGYPFGQGVAYSAHTEKYLLNVRAVNMSAFDEEPQHFLDWLHTQHNYRHIARNILANVYVPRKVYGSYLNAVWQYATTHKRAETVVQIINGKATDIQQQQQEYTITLDNSASLAASFVILATGNTAPRELHTAGKDLPLCMEYFGNPWCADCVANAHQLRNILIAGNGLTMIDTLQGLRENHFTGTVYTISPNGFSLLPHKYNLLVYDKLVEALPATPTLKEVFSLVHQHAKALEKVGIGAHLVIDSLRPHTQQLWQAFSLEEKRKFLKRLSHKWTIFRHRLPLHIFEEVQQLRITQKMITLTGRLTNVQASNEKLQVTFFNNTSKTEEHLIVDRIINCTGPEANICRSANELLRNLSAKGIIKPDPLQLGIAADPQTGAVINLHGETNPGIFTIGGNLKGVLWESTAIPDLRVQARRLAQHLAHITHLVEQTEEPAVPFGKNSIHGSQAAMAVTIL
ncbi:FAD/NAD(P)-binding protein [Panacibacter sp. DH6]|uniref:FAD/NAD(P)-binding protein n=1 Tax=Panacibacter microcysteis TaxID=2793269 RepID=A0A931E948_9BACT|nr:FAD/NAD(P)-binding protein [Panacibacter microcysteis]MBG9375991.1 FAD/NAD(P)-binding protein [Panacibacter microcysteis]